MKGRMMREADGVAMEVDVKVVEICSFTDCFRKAGNAHWSGLCGLHFVWLLHRKRTRGFCTCGLCKKGEREYCRVFQVDSVPPSISLEGFKAIQRKQTRLFRDKEKEQSGTPEKD